MWKSPLTEFPAIFFECECSEKSSIEYMYFCFQCTKILCQYCIVEEIDSFFCRNCMENMIGTEAMSLKNRCSSCYQCPVCFSKLQVLQNYSKQQKFLYLGCQRCFWDSIKQGIIGNTTKDIIMACQSFFKNEDPLQQHYQGLVEKYRATSRPPRKKTHRKRAETAWTFESLKNKLKTHELTPNEEFIETPPVALEEILEFKYENYTTIEQRFINLAEQPRLLSEATTEPMQLLTKRSKRCKHCNKYVVKPETRPNNYSYFKMENLLVYFLPRILVRSFDERMIRIIVTNPTSGAAYIKLVHALVPPDEVHIDSYDPVMDLVTAEGTSAGQDMVVSREKNFVVLEFERVEDEIRLGVNWKFSRGAELKEIDFYIIIKLRE